ncbi:dihydrofolate reductase family protein [Foetidibacter luteolus]|uniref:dihydrofolate reductase family protein n=1 Tax=Foetidibacter luteolus TaxID=2608880 RepID=UPI00129AB9F5|nr:dihydrofolate reductase family protein [Foetidibacter luteolus]
MKKIILDLAVTLDGLIEGPNGEVDWCIMDGESGFLDFLEDVDTIFYGRVSYDLWGNWQPADEYNDTIKQAYQQIHQKTKYVFSTTKNSGDGNATYINDNMEEKVAHIKQQPGKNIWLYGGGNLITSFINAGLIDVYRLAVHPVILGAGKPLFQNLQHRTGLKLTGYKASTSGVILLTYEKQ